MSDELKLKMCFIARQIVGQVASCTYGLLVTISEHFERQSERRCTEGQKGGNKFRIKNYLFYCVLYHLTIILQGIL